MDKAKGVLLGAVAFVIAWWLLRKKDEECHCGPAATVPVAGTGSQPAPQTTATTIAQPTITPAPIQPGTYLPQTARPWDQCAAAGGAWSSEQVCLFPDGPRILPVPPVPRGAIPNTCESIGGVTLADGSCCAPPCIPPGVWTGYTDPRVTDSHSGPPAIPVAAPTRPPSQLPDQGDYIPRPFLVNCAHSGGTPYDYQSGPQCACPPGTRVTAEGLCVSVLG